MNVDDEDDEDGEEDDDVDEEDGEDGEEEVGLDYLEKDDIDVSTIHIWRRKSERRFGLHVVFDLCALASRCAEQFHVLCIS